MRKFLYFAPVAIGLAVLFGSWYYAADDGRKTLARAIAAHGGEGNLAKSKTGTIKWTGRKIIAAHGSELAKFITWEESFQQPDRLKRTIRQNFMGQTTTFTYLYRDGKMWSRQDDREATVQQIDSPVLDNLAVFLIQLVEFYKQKVPLKALEEAVVGGRPVVGLEVSSKEGKLRLFFDKTNGLLAKLERPSPDAEDESVMLEIVCKDYREYQGVWMPGMMSMYRNGNLDFELTLKEVKFVDHLDDSVFAKP